MRITFKRGKRAKQERWSWLPFGAHLFFFCGAAIVFVMDGNWVWVIASCLGVVSTGFVFQLNQTLRDQVEVLKKLRKHDEYALEQLGKALAREQSYNRDTTQ